jgi:hypothetical protein
MPKKGRRRMTDNGNGQDGAAVASLGPPTIPIDQVYGMMRELEVSHQILDALGAPQGPLPDRLAWRARDWLRRVGPASQTRIGIEARKILKAGGYPVGVYSRSVPKGPSEGTSTGANHDEA